MSLSETMVLESNTIYRQCSSVSEALQRLGDIVEQQKGGDLNYFAGQKGRYSYSISRIKELRPAPCRVLDIGSHYLHQTILLRLLGYDVSGMDVPFFADTAFIQDRAAAIGVRNFSTQGHQSGDFLTELESAFDVIVCTEMLEHIAFNPVAFWKRVWKLLAPGGIIYLTTPNAFRVRALLKAIARLVSFEGLGIPVRDVLTVITYGHHWKEYSCREIKQYFGHLSPDFVVETKTYPEFEGDASVFSKALELAPPFRTNIEAVVRISGKTRFFSAPTLPMQKVKEDRRP